MCVERRKGIQRGKLWGWGECNVQCNVFAVAGLRTFSRLRGCPPLHHQPEASAVRQVGEIPEKLPVASFLFLLHPSAYSGAGSPSTQREGGPQNLGGAASASCAEIAELNNKFSKGAGYKINIQKSVAFLYTNNEILEKENA